MFAFWNSLRNIPELWKKILFTLGMLAIYRVGFYIPLPIIDQSQLGSYEQGLNQSGLGSIMNTVAMFGGTKIGMSTIFGLGIMPYISASIIFQLLGSVVPALEALMKEGESGRKKINEYTRYATVFICLLQSSFWVRYLMSSNNLVPAEYQTFLYGFVCVMIMTAGTIFLMWIGEQIDEYGIGNGISMLIMAGILARMPSALWELIGSATTKLSPDSGEYGPITLIFLVIMFVAVMMGVITMTESQRRIPTQSAKHVRGRKVFGGTRQYLPLKVNQAGVMPIIFASSLLMLPMMFFNVLRQATGEWARETGFKGGFARFLEDATDAFSSQHGVVYLTLYIVLIYFFCYFWTAIQFNPKDMSENLKDYGSFIPGYRPGKRTADYLEKVMLRITYVGAAFLSVVAVLPTLIQSWLLIPYAVASFLGGTGLLIVVSVCLDLVQKVDSHLIMRNYPSILNKK